MSARRQHRTYGPVEGLDLAGSLRDCLASGVLVINAREEIASATHVQLSFRLHECLVIKAREQIVSATPEVERLLLLAPGKSVDKPLALLPHPLQNVVREAIASKVTVIRDHLTLTLAGKRSRNFHVTAQPIQREAGSLDIVVVLCDVTTFAQLEHGIIRLDRLATLGSLSADMAHEIKNALVAVKTFVDLLLEKHHQEELAGIVSREMRRLDTIMRQMLRFSGKEGSAHGPVRLHDVLEHSLRMVQQQLEGKSISLNRAFNATPDTVHGNDHQLEQVFVNLLLNAVEASGPNGSLTVATDLVAPASPRPGQPHVRITVADTGTGIAPENLDRMFEPFFTTKHNGTGLGLPITQRIVHEHHGHITVDSEPNKGTTFSIHLPAGDHDR